MTRPADVRARAAKFALLVAAGERDRAWNRYAATDTETDFAAYREACAAFDAARVAEAGLHAPVVASAHRARSVAAMTRLVELGLD